MRFRPLASYRGIGYTAPTMLPANLLGIQVLVPTAGTPVSIGSALTAIIAATPALQGYIGLKATNLTIFPGKGANGRTANAGVVYLGFGYATATAPNSGNASFSNVGPVAATSPWLPLNSAPTIPLQLFPDLSNGGALDLNQIYVDAATNGDGINVLAIFEPTR